MKQALRPCGTILAALTLVTPLAVGDTGPQYRELPNFHQVNEHLYRGGQPRKGGIDTLAKLGVCTIVNLRGEDAASRAEKTEVEARGMRYFGVSMPGVGRPGEGEVNRVMAIIDAQENWPVFVHCNHGSDRTGTVIACYHILHDGWGADRAIAEARHYGMSWIELGMRDYIYGYYALQKRSGNKQAVTSP